MDGRVAPSVPAADTGNPGGCSFNEVPAVNTLTLFMCIFVLYVACMPPFTGVSITLSLSLRASMHSLWQCAGPASEVVSDAILG